MRPEADIVMGWAYGQVIMTGSLRLNLPLENQTLEYALPCSMASQETATGMQWAGSAFLSDALLINPTPLTIPTKYGGASYRRFFGSPAR